MKFSFAISESCAKLREVARSCAKLREVARSCAKLREDDQGIFFLDCDDCAISREMYRVHAKVDKKARSLQK
jgi:hypothetical protein